MTEFKVGDKVRAFGTREGVVTYGPIASTFSRHTLYAVKETVSGNEVAHHVGDLRAAPVVPAFAVGDTITLTTRDDARATVEYGPFDRGAAYASRPGVYVVKLVDPCGRRQPADVHGAGERDEEGGGRYLHVPRGYHVQPRCEIQRPAGVRVGLHGPPQPGRCPAHDGARQQAEHRHHRRNRREFRPPS